MADAKISDLAAVTDIGDEDAYVVARSGASKKITGASLKGTFDAAGAAATAQTTAEAYADTAVSTHSADTMSVHGIADTSALALSADVPSNATFNDHSARHEDGGADEISVAGLDGVPTELQNHLDDTADAHDASAISVADAGGYFTGADVEAALQELGAGSGASSAGAAAYGFQSSPVVTSGTSAATGANVLDDDLSFTADGTSDYLLTIYSPECFDNDSGAIIRLSLLLDGSVGAQFFNAQPSAANRAASVAAGCRIATPSAGGHTVNVIVHASTGQATLYAGDGSSGASSEIVVKVEKL